MKKIFLVALIALVSISCSDDSIEDSIESNNLFWKSNQNTIWEGNFTDDYHTYTQYFKFHDNLQKPFDWYSKDKDEHCFDQHGFYFDMYNVEIQEQTKNSLTILLLQENSIVIATLKFSISGNKLTVVIQENGTHPHTKIYNRTSLTYADIIQCP